jgi:hypothetical protein
LEFVDGEGMGQENTLLANIWWGMRLENIIVFFLVGENFPCRLELSNLDLASVGINRGVILLPAGWNNDRRGDSNCWMTLEIELEKGVHFGGRRECRAARETLRRGEFW